MWNRDQISEGTALIDRAFSTGRAGPYVIQGAIAATHASAPTSGETDWGEIIRLYDALLYAEPSPVIELNRAVAIAMRDGPLAGLTLIDGIFARGDLADYHFAHSAHGELCSRLGRKEEARTSFERALALAQQEPVRRFLVQRLKELA